MKTGWVLKNKRGKIYADTFAVDRASCWAEALHRIEWERKGFNSSYWKNWNEIVRAAKLLGYEVVRVKLVEV